MHSLARSLRWRWSVLTSAELWQDLVGRERAFCTVDAHMGFAADWIERAIQATGGRGVAAHYRIGTGWGSGYAETTGYILPTLLRVAAWLNRPALKQRALEQAEWLLTTQLASGGFPGGEARLKLEETVFNTGQVIRGLVAAWEESGVRAFLNGATRAGQWLVSVQSEDGAWRRFTSPLTTTREHSYDVLTAWGLYSLGRAAGRDEFCEAALRQYRWTLSRQRANGFFDGASFETGAPPLTHSLGYVAEGVFEISREIGDAGGVEACRRLISALRSRFPERPMLPGRVDGGFRSAAKWSCLVGNLQVGWVSHKLGDLLKEESLRAWGRNVIRTTAATQRPDAPSPGVRGGVFGSFPIYGGYFPFATLNWGAKYLIDALCELDEST